MNCIILNSNIGLTVGSITNFKCVLSLGIKPGPPPSLSFSSMETFSSVSITLLVFFAQTGTSLEIFKYKVELDVNTNLVLRWGIDYNMARIYFELSATVLPGQGLMFGFSDYGDVTGADVAVLGTHFGKVKLKVRIISKGVRNQEGGGGGLEKMLTLKLHFHQSMFYCLLNEIKIIISFSNQDFLVKHALSFFSVTFFSCS